MSRTIRYAIVSVVMVTAGVSCAIGVGMGLWTVLSRDAGAGTMLLRGLLALIAVVALSLVPGIVMAHAFSRSMRELAGAVDQLRAGSFRIDPRPTQPAEFVELAGAMRELGTFLEERDRSREQAGQDGARDLRKDALLRFGQGVTREVQKSLAGVLGFVEIALRQPGLEGQLKNYLTLIDQEARSGREALERILRYAREEPFPTEPLDINALLMEASRGFLDSQDKEQLQVQLNLAKDLPKILGDATQLKYVLNTLINNAREAILPDEEGTLELSTNLDGDGKVVAMVKDSGCGIPPDEQPRVFTPFFTSKGSQKGAGLSLAIAERIVSQHGGRLDFWSELGKGSVFFVHLPPVTEPKGAEIHLQAEGLDEQPQKRPPPEE